LRTGLKNESGMTFHRSVWIMLPAVLMSLRLLTAATPEPTWPYPLSPEQRARLLTEMNEAREAAPSTATPFPSPTATPTPPPLAPPMPLSIFESYVRGQLPAKVSKEITQFGYDLFRRPPVTFAPAEVVPVGPDYLLGPGDELRITVWGKVLNAEYSPVIDRDGKISLPTLGVLHLAGLTFKETKEFISNEFKRYYTDLNLNVSMGSLRSIQIFVVGNARSPGRYTVSSFSTLINALFAAGGPSKAGTMRDMRLVRSGTTIVHFDLYDFLLRGDKSRDVRLMPEDVVFLPPVGPLVAVAGNIKCPAIYELKGETRLSDAIEMAGGFAPTANVHRIELERVSEAREQIVRVIDLDSLPEKDNITLEDGDVIKVHPIAQRITNPIYLRGNVLTPGTYEWYDGIRVKDIIPSVEYLLPETFMDFALVERLVPPDLHKEYFSFSPGKALVEGDEKENARLQPHDVIMVFNTWEVIPRKKVRVTGAVHKPGEYEFRTNMRLSDLVELAGGVKRYAYVKEAELTRVTPTDQGPETEKIMVTLEPELLREPANDILLQEDDYLFVRAVPEWQLYQTVTLEGEVNFPGIYTITKGEALSSVIERAGGFTDSAYLKGTLFTRESVRELQQRNLEDAIDRLEQQLLAQSAERVQAALSPEEAQREAMLTERQRALLSKLKTARATGRVTIRLGPLEEFFGSPHDIALEDGDTVLVPQMPQHVQVIGAAFNPTAFLYEPGRTVSSYLNQAGGLTADANEKSIYVLKVDGTAVSGQTGRGFRALRWDPRSNRWVGGRLMSLVLDPGDTIVVPERIEKIVWLREIKDITQILYQVAVTAGVIIVAF